MDFTDAGNCHANGLVKEKPAPAGQSAACNPAGRLGSRRGSHRPPGMSTLRKRVDKNCVLGTYRVAATKLSFLSAVSANPAMIRVCVSRKRFVGDATLA